MLITIKDSHVFFPAFHKSQLFTNMLYYTTEITVDPRYIEVRLLRTCTIAVCGRMVHNIKKKKIVKDT